MNENSREELMEAVELLIRHPEARRLFQSMVAVAQIAIDHPVQLIGQAAPLNALMRLWARNRDAGQRVIELVERKRAEQALPPLQQVDKPSEGFDKTEYMRGFMDRKRERQRKAVEIENMMRPPKDALKGRARLDFMDRQAAKWKSELDGILESARRHSGGAISRERENALRDQFWAKIDKELSELEELARTEMLKRR